jgi:hypothetical protein
MKPLLIAGTLLALQVFSAGIAQTPDKRPEVPKSIANAKAEHFRNGPLFKRTQSAFAAANDRGEVALAEFLANDAKLELSTYTYPNPSIHEPLNIERIRAIMSSCDGPISYDEGRDWTQLSWVCRIDSAAPLSQYYTFHDSPEIVMHVNYDGDQIKRISAMEPLMIPGIKYLAMNAYEVAHSKQAPPKP